MPHEYDTLPQYWSDLNKLWTQSLDHFVSSGIPPCLWVNKPAGCVVTSVGGRCPCDHQVLPALIKQVNSTLAGKPAEWNKHGGVFAAKASGQKIRCDQCRADASLDRSKRCSICSNTVYCSSSCMQLHSKVHSTHCRPVVPAPHSVELGSSWVVVLPADPDRRPYAALSPSGGPELQQFHKTIFGQMMGITARPPERSQRGRDDGILIFFNASAPKTTSPPNLRASAILTPLDFNRKPLANEVATSGPGVVVRGDALIVRFPPTVTALTSATRSIDFSYGDFDGRWGLMQSMEMMGVTGVTLLGNNAEGLATLASLNQQLAASSKGAKK